MTTHAATAHGHQAIVPHGSSENRGMMGMGFFIASEVMLFAGLFACYFYVRSQAETWPPEGVEHTPDWALGAVLSVILITSGVFAHYAIVALREGRVFGLPFGNRQGFLLGLAIAMVLGTIFTGLQIMEWFTLFDEGLTAKTTVYGSTFFILTGFHGAHVIAGLFLLFVAFVRGIWGDMTPNRHLIGDASVLYWHFVDFIWIFVYLILYDFP